MSHNVSLKVLSSVFFLWHTTILGPGLFDPIAFHLSQVALFAYMFLVKSYNVA
jgi:hypothetical protein